MLINRLMLFCCSRGETCTRDEKCLKMNDKNEWQKVKVGWFGKKKCLFCYHLPFSHCLPTPEWLWLASVFDCAGKHISFFPCLFPSQNAFLNHYIKTWTSKSFCGMDEWTKKLFLDQIISPPSENFVSILNSLSKKGKFFISQAKSTDTVKWVRQDHVFHTLRLF